MPTFRIATALLLCGTAAAHAQQIQPLIDRPLTLPERAADVTLQGTYTNWAAGVVAPSSLGALDGETLAIGVDYGATDRVQLGLATVLPVNPGAAFGSIVGTAVIAAASKPVAFRIDAGFESIGVNGDNTAGTSHASRFFAGFGAPLKIPIAPTVAFVSGRTGAVQFGHFNNIGTSGTGEYLGASGFTQTASDLLVISGGDNNSNTIVGINLPAGLMFQPESHFALTLHAGYSAAISFPSGGGSTMALHYMPVGLEAVLMPAPRVDIGARFFVDGYVAQSGGGAGSTPGYFDLREVMFWTRVHL
jgi:hypothetical protein